MQKNEFSSQTIQEVEEEMIQTIITSYFQCREFFDTHQNYNDINAIKEKKALKRNLSHNFYSKFKNHASVLSNNDADEVLSDLNIVIIQFKNGSFVYPKSFVRYMDHLQDVNYTPIREIDLSQLDEFMDTFNPKFGLYNFFARFFDTIKLLNVCLRPREYEMLQLLTNLDYLYRTPTGEIRYYPPSLKEMASVMGHPNTYRATRAYNFLYSNRICYLNTVILNNAKFGFLYTSIDYPRLDKSYLNEIEKYIFWNINFQDHSTAIVSIPFGNVEEILQPFDFLPLTNWDWSVNFDQFKPEKYDTSSGWKKYSFPNLIASDVQTQNFVSWDLTNSYKKDFRDKEIEILRNLSSTPVLSLDSFENFSKTTSSSGVNHIVKKFAQNDVFRLYPRTTHLDLYRMYCIKINAQNKELLNQFVHKFLLFPVSSILSNPDASYMIGYYYVPTSSIHLMDYYINMAKTYYPEIDIQISDYYNPPKVGTTTNLHKTPFKVENGYAYLID